MSTRPSNSRSWLALIPAFVLAGAIAAGCGGREEAEDSPAPLPAEPQAAAEQAPAGGPDLTPEQRKQLSRYVDRQRKAAAPAKPKVVRIDPAEGEDTIELPEDFPADLPLHPGSSPIGYVSSQPGGNMTTLVVDETPQSAASFYSSALEGEGWDVTLDGGTEQLIMISAAKEGRTLAVALADENGVTTITLLEE
jgi:hypothetical protein